MRADDGIKCVERTTVGFPIQSSWVIRMPAERILMVKTLLVYQAQDPTMKGMTMKTMILWENYSEIEKMIKFARRSVNSKTNVIPRQWRKLECGY